MCTAGTLLYANWLSQSQINEIWYLSPLRLGSQSTFQISQTWITFLILFNNLVPISLYISLEFVKTIQAYFISQDLMMFYSPLNLPALARTSNINEDLGQIEHIFTDKTGTLTRNHVLLYYFIFI